MIAGKTCSRDMNHNPGPRKKEKKSSSPGAYRFFVMGNRVLDRCVSRKHIRFVLKPSCHLIPAKGLDHASLTLFWGVEFVCFAFALAVGLTASRSFFHVPRLSKVSCFSNTTMAQVPGRHRSASATAKSRRFIIQACTTRLARLVRVQSC